MSSNLSGTVSQAPRVLVIEDSDINRHLAQHLLTQMGCHTEAVSNGHDAVKAFTEGSYDLIVLDCRLPGFPQFMVARMIRLQEDKRTPGSRIPIVGLTAYAPAGFRQHCLQAGMNGCYEKPFRGELVRHILQQWLPAFFPPRLPAATSWPQVAAG